MSYSKPQPTSIIQELYKKYNECLKNEPILTKSVTSAVTAALGDIICQLGNRTASYDYRSTVAFALFGFFATGPITHYFYTNLSKVVPNKVKQAWIMKLVIERLVFAPAFLLLFFYVVPVLQGKSLSEVKERVKLTYWAALKTNWRIWTIAQYVNLKYIPQQYQTLCANVVGLFWNIYLSMKQR